MTTMLSQQEAHFLRAARLQIGLSTEEAAQLVHASRRSWEGWESCSRPIPRATLDLFRAKIEGGYRRDNLGAPRQLVAVFLMDDQGWAQPIDVVSSDNFVGLVEFDNGEALIKSLAIDHITRRPYVHKTIFKCDDNKHVIRAARTWTSVVDAE